MSKVMKVDLMLLKKFVGELEAGVAAANAISAVEGDVSEYLVELAKASGLAASVMQEASMLVGDIQSQMMIVQSPTVNKSDFMDKLLGGLKGGPLGGGPFGGGSAN